VIKNRVLRKIFRSTKRGALGNVLLTIFYSGKQVKKSQMGKVFGTYRKEERFGGETRG
jgi:hypothetical protein